MAIADLVTPKYRDFLVSAAADPDAWPLALHDISHHSRSTGAILFHRSAMPGTPVSAGVAEGMETYWKDNWISRDIRLRAIPVQTAVGLGTDEDCVSADEMHRAPLYNEFLARFGLKWFAGVGFKVAGQMWCLSIQRSPRQGMFDAAERRVLREMSRVMAEVGDLNHLMAEAKVKGLTKALDQFGDHWMTFDLLGRRIEEGNDDTSSPSGAPPLRSLARGGALSSCVADVLGSAMRAGSPDGRPAEGMVMAAPGRPVGIKALRLCHIHAGFGRAQYLVVFREAGMPRRRSGAVIMERWGLTPAEAELAALIAEGVSLRDAAQRRHVSYETARTQLRSVFAKCGVNRQATLTALLRSN